MWDVVLRGVHVTTHIKRHARAAPLCWAPAIKTACQSYFLVGGHLGYSQGFRQEERESRLTSRVVLERSGQRRDRAQRTAAAAAGMHTIHFDSTSGQNVRSGIWVISGTSVGNITRSKGHEVFGGWNLRVGLGWVGVLNVFNRERNNIS